MAAAAADTNGLLGGTVAAAVAVAHSRGRSHCADNMKFISSTRLYLSKIVSNISAARLGGQLFSLRITTRQTVAALDAVAVDRPHVN